MKRMSGIGTLNGRTRMTDPHEKVTEDRRKAAEEVMDAYDKLCDAADQYGSEEDV